MKTFLVTLTLISLSFCSCKKSPVNPVDIANPALIEKSCDEVLGTPPTICGQSPDPDVEIFGNDQIGCVYTFTMQVPGESYETTYLVSYTNCPTLQVAQFTVRHLLNDVTEGDSERLSFSDESYLIDKAGDKVIMFRMRNIVISIAYTPFDFEESPCDINGAMLEYAQDLNRNL